MRVLIAAGMATVSRILVGAEAMQTPVTEPKLITRDGWERIVAQHRGRFAKTQGKRSHVRRSALGDAKVSYTREGIRASASCLVREVSAEGLTLCFDGRVPPDVTVLIEIALRDQMFLLSGRTVYCTRINGVLQVGVHLCFDH